MIIGWGTAVAQQVPSPDEGSRANEEFATDSEDTVVLSPFLVESDGDSGYRATNTITGTRLNREIKDIPLSLEVVTNDLIRDTGSLDLREALRYSAGVVLESQNDGFAYNWDTLWYDITSNGPNQRQAHTGSTDRTTFKIRGFLAHALRDGFKRNHAVDAVNIDRIEILRGPSALLYGVGNLGGVINYLPKRPTMDNRGFVGLTMGSWDLYRAEFDFSGQFNSEDELNQGYRITGSWQSNSDYTDGTYHRDAWFIAPTFTFQLPNRTTNLVFDLELGESREKGMGFTSVATYLDYEGQWIRDRLVGPGEGTPKAKDPRTWKWSGPDTWRNNPAMTITADLQQQLGRDSWLRVGAQYSRNEVDGRNIWWTHIEAIDDTRWSHRWYREPQNDAEQDYLESIKTFNPSGMYLSLPNRDREPERHAEMMGLFERRPPDFWYGDVFEAGKLPGYTAPANLFKFAPGPTTSSDYLVLRYQWGEAYRTTEEWQGRIEFVHAFDLLGTRNTLLLGAQSNDGTFIGKRYRVKYWGEDEATMPGTLNHASVVNPRKIRYDVQGDGVTPTNPYDFSFAFGEKWQDRGAYAVLQSSLWDDRLNVVGGVRWDRTEGKDDISDWLKGLADPSEVPNESLENWTGSGAKESISPQFGITWALSPDLSVFGVYSTGSVPNRPTNTFSLNQAVLDGYGNRFDPMKAENIELGLKFDLLDGRLSGTISAFRIQRSNIPILIEWAPSPGIPAAQKWHTADYDPDQRAALPNLGYHPYLAFLMRDVPGFDQVDPVACAFMQGIPGDPRDGLKPYGFGDVSGDAIDPYAIVRDPATGEMKEAGVLWMEYGGWTREQYENRGLFAHDLTWATTEDLKLIAIDQDTEAGRAGREFLRKGFDTLATGEISRFGQFWDSNGKEGTFGDGTEGISNSLALVSGGAYVPYDDESKGFEIQVLWVPVDGLQLRLGYSYLDNRVTSETYEFAAFPEPNDQAEFGRWAYPAENWGTYGLRTDAAFADPNDPSTSLLEPVETGGPIEDTPVHTATWWAKYSFESDVLKGWSLGLGGSYQSKRLYNHGALAAGVGVGERDENGRFVVQREYTQVRWRWSGLIEYRFVISDRYRTRIALNVDNLADDKALYGYVYAPGRSAKLSVGVNF